MNLDINGEDMQRKNADRKFNITGFFSSLHFLWDSKFIFQGESHEMWEIVYINSGKVEVTENERIYLLEKNHMIIHAPWEFHRICSAGGTSPEVYVMSFFAVGDLPLKLKKGIFVLNIDQAIQYMGVFESIASFMNQESSSVYAGQEAADSLSAFLIRLSEERTNICLDTSLSATEYRKIVVAMSKGICDNKTLEDFARECGDSVSYIKQLFQKYAGISPKAYYNKLRIRYASNLLDSGEAVSTIAEKMNFSSSNYFSAFFKKHTGYSPIEYKFKTCR